MTVYHDGCFYGQSTNRRFYTCAIWPATNTLRPSASLLLAAISSDICPRWTPSGCAHCGLVVFYKARQFHISNEAVNFWIKMILLAAVLFSVIMLEISLYIKHVLVPGI